MTLPGLQTIALATLTEPGWHPIAKLGQYQDRRYGKFSITRADYEAWVRNLHARQNGELPVDYDHQAEAGNTKAAGWIRELKLDGDTVLARIEWTPEGQDNVRQGYWRYVSPSFTSSYRDEKGKNLGKALLGVALTNRPFLRAGMPALNLSAEDPFARQLAAPPGPANGGVCPDCGQPLPSDAQPGNVIECACGQKVTMSDPGSQPPSDSTGEGEPMPEPTGNEHTPDPAATALNADTAPGADTQGQNTMTSLSDTFRLALGLPEDADDAQAADAIRTLREDAAAGRDAQEQLRVQTFTLAYAEAVREGRAAPAQEETLRALYDAAPEQTLTLLKDAPAVVPTAPRGTGAERALVADAEKFSDGAHAVDEDRLELMAKAEALAAAESIDLIDAAERILAGATTTEA